MWICVYVYIINHAKVCMINDKDRKEVTRINSTVESKLEKKFRELANKKFDYKKGSIQFGLEEAIDLWIKEQAKKEKK